MFEIGDKVVCVDDAVQSNPSALIDGDRVKLGVLYVIRGFSSLGGPLLVGLCGGFWSDGEEVSFKPSRFRKLSDMQAEARERRKERQPA
jgi:hypothetical protein